MALHICIAGVLTMEGQANWDDLRLLLAVSRRGSFLQAGQWLGIAPSTVARRLSQLELALGEPLVERGVEGCRLTSRGEALLQVAVAAEAGLRRQAVASAPGPQAALAGTVLVSTGEGFTASVLEAIRRFTTRHTGCSVELQVTADFHKVARGVADVAIRTAHLGEPSLVYRPVGRVAYGVFATQAYLQSVAGLAPASVGMVTLLPPLDGLPQMRAARAAGFEHTQVSVSSFAAQLAAVRLGLGAAVLPRVVADGLVEAFAGVQLPDMEVYLVTRPQALKQAHIRGFYEVLEEVLVEALVV